jgi:4-amino-4-deoxy-L-arabinose transferase-like glycosyltransferase
MNKRFFTTASLFLIIIISLIGGYIAYRATVNGPWGYTDPVVYISTAANILAGNGIGYFEGNAVFHPITLHGPFYSIVLAAIGLTKINLIHASRILNISCFILSIFLAGFLFTRFTRRPGLGVLSSILIMVFPGMFMMYCSAYSEPLFLCLFFLAVYFLLSYFTRQRTFDFLLSAILLGLSAVTRYVGVAFIGAAVLSIFFLTKEKFFKRTWKTFIFGLIAALPFILWLLYVANVSQGTVGGREFNLDLLQLANGFQNFRAQLMDVIWIWLPFQKVNTELRYSHRYVILFIGFLILFVTTLLAEKKLKHRGSFGQANDGTTLILFSALSSALFIFVTCITYLFSSPSMDIDIRTMLPLFPLLVFLLLACASQWEEAWLSKNWNWVSVLPFLIVGVFVYWYVPTSFEKFIIYRPGWGLTAYWHDQSPTIQAVRELPEDQTIISNEWELVYLWTNHPMHSFWNTFPNNGSELELYGTNPSDATQVLFCEDDTLLVILFQKLEEQVYDQLGPDYVEQIPQLFQGLEVVSRYPDGAIYRCP